jgi:hypothetical protein
MSLITQCFSFLAIKPRVWIDGYRLCARASRVTRIASLGAYDRCVVADRRERLISIHKKDCWSWQPAVKIPFDRVVEIDRSFDRWSTKRCPDHYTYTRWSRTDQLEFFKVSLFLRNPQENVDLFWFWGEGSVKTGATGVLLCNDDVFDFAGDQRATSERYAKLLAAFAQTRVHDFPPQGFPKTVDTYAH